MQVFFKLKQFIIVVVNILIYFFYDQNISRPSIFSYFYIKLNTKFFGSHYNTRYHKII